MIRIGFSTSKRNIFSAVIRWFTKSRVSHAWVLIHEPFFDMEMVLEATEFGFRMVPYETFRAKTNVIEVLTLGPSCPLDSAVKRAGRRLGEDYDFLGLFGGAIVQIGRWLKYKWRNPLASSRAMFCSEAVVYVLQDAGYPGADTLDPEATTPQDLLDFLRSSSCA